VRHVWDQFKQPSAASLHQRSIARFGSLSGNGRYTYWKAAIDSMPGHWLAGYGTGSFQFVWFQHGAYFDYIRNAHSLYVESLNEVGLVGLTLLVAFLGLIVVVAVRRTRSRDPEIAVLAAAAAAAMIAFATSAAFDWVWQVPVLPVAVLLLAAAVLAPSQRPILARAARDRTPAQRPSRPRFVAVRGGLIVSALACLLAIGVALSTTRAVRASQAAATGGNLAAAESNARLAVSLEPAEATSNLQLALVLELEGRLGPAVASARRSAQAEPANAEPWLVLSRLEAESGHAGASVAAYDHARSVNPKSPLFG
jgi:hypothetical protein